MLTQVENGLLHTLAPGGLIGLLLLSKQIMIMKNYLLIIGLTATTLASAQLTSSLSACYALDGNANDPISGLTGTLSSVTSTVDRNNNVGSAYNFSGASSSKISLPNDVKLKGNEMSFSCWVKPVLTSSSQYIVFTKNQASGNFEAYTLVYNSAGNFVAVKGNNGTVVNAASTATYAGNTWYHVAFAFNTNSLQVYVNGSLTANNSTSLAVAYDATTGVVLGGSGESFNLPYSGSLDNVRFYNRMLSATEVGQLYSQDPGCVNTNTNTTGISKINRGENVLSVYPNPAQERITIDFNNEVSGQLMLRTILGNVVLSNPVNNQTTAELDLFNLKSGVYFVEFYSGNNKQVKKFVKN